MAEKIVVKMAICDDVKEVCVQLEQLLIPAFGAIGKECDIDQFETGEAFGNNN